MSLFKTQTGHVHHADAVPYVKAVPNRREAESAYIKIITTLDWEQVDDLGDEISLLRDFIYSR